MSDKPARDFDVMIEWRGHGYPHTMSDSPPITIYKIRGCDLGPPDLLILPDGRPVRRLAQHASGAGVPSYGYLPALVMRLPAEGDAYEVDVPSLVRAGSSDLLTAAEALLKDWDSPSLDAVAAERFDALRTAVKAARGT